MHKAYLAGGMEYAMDSGSAWRKDMTRFLAQFGWETFDPTIAENNGELPDWEQFERLKDKDFNLYCSRMKDIVKLDIDNLKQCQAVIVLVDSSALRGAGTKGELTVATIDGIPIWSCVTTDLRRIPGWMCGTLDPTKMKRNLPAFYKMLVEGFPRMKEPANGVWMP